MPLEFLRKADVIKVVEAVNGIPKRLIVFLFDKQVIISIVDGLNVKLMEKIEIISTQMNDPKDLRVAQQLSMTEWAEYGRFGGKHEQHGCGQCGE